MDINKVGTEAFILLVLGAIFSFVIPLLIAIVWKKKKKEPFSTILVGAAIFLLFALILGKPIQALVIAIDHPVSRFLKAYPVLLALVLGFFPGIFEETGRFIAFKTLLKKRKNKETSISYGIGHGGFEAMILLGMVYITYIYFAIMINAGTFETLVNQAAAKAPNQANALTTIAKEIADINVIKIILGFLERAFAILIQIGLSILVFYACRDKGKFWLYPFAILLHTIIDFTVGLKVVNVLNLSAWAVEGILSTYAILTFCGAYFLLYKKDLEEQVSPL